jgi:hypothetical protein
VRAAANPFIISTLAREAGFADREEEVARIEAGLRTPGGKLVVYGDRRLGKSSALERAADLVRAAGGRAAVASFATASDASEAAQRVLTAAQRSVGPSWRELLEAVGRSLRAGFEVSPSMDPGGAPGIRFRFAVEPHEHGTLLPDALTALDEQLTRRGLTLGLGIDEFQRLHEWGGEAAEWALREAIQRHGSIGYVLAGSRRHLIEAMIGVKGRALWKLADVLRFGPIDAGLMADWIVEQAAAQGVAVPAAEAAGIIRLAGPRTRDIVQLARGVWALSATSGGAVAGSAAVAFDAIVAEQGELYRTIFTKLTARQQGVLRAFAAEPDVQITSAAAQRRYRLGAKSTVQSTVSALVEAEHLVRDDGGGYTFDDPYFRRWVQLHALADIGESAPLLPG